jgi:hypothetical protein
VPYFSSFHTYTSAFRSWWDIPTNRYFIGNIGGNNQSVAVEEIYLGVNNGFYGWPVCEGACNNPDYPGGCTCSKVQVSCVVPSVSLRHFLLLLFGLLEWLVVLIIQSALWWHNHKDSQNPTYYNSAVIAGFVYRGSMFPSK